MRRKPRIGIVPGSQHGRTSKDPGQPGVHNRRQHRTATLPELSSTLPTPITELPADVSLASGRHSRLSQ